MHTLTISTQRNGDVLTVVVAGEIDMGTAPELRAALEAALATQPGHIRVDLEAVPFLDSSGISALIAGWRDATAASAQFSVHNPQPIVQEVITVSGVSAMLNDTVSGS